MIGCSYTYSVRYAVGCTYRGLATFEFYSSLHGRAKLGRVDVACPNLCILAFVRCHVPVGLGARRSLSSPHATQRHADTAVFAVRSAISRYARRRIDCEQQPAPGRSRLHAIRLVAARGWESCSLKPRAETGRRSSTRAGHHTGWQNGMEHACEDGRARTSLSCTR